MNIPDEGLKLNVGCGRHTLDGWFCIDAVQHPNATRPLDLISNAIKIDLPDACANEIMAIHFWEHLYRWQCDEVITEWKRLLRPRGRLLMEMPDLMKFCRNIMRGLNDSGRHPDQMGMWAMYGDPRTKDPYMVHKWAWTFTTLKKFLAGHGFIDIVEEETQWHPVGRALRDFRIVAVRG